MNMKNRTRFCSIILIILQFFNLISCIKKDSRVNQNLVDIEGNSYKTITIGTQVWMAENLKTTKFNDGSEIPEYYYHNDSSSYSEIYGVLYSLNSVKESKLCPTGWHVPTATDWELLSEYLGGDSIAGSKLKEEGLAHWSLPNSDATNESGFTALPGGYRFLSPYHSMCCGTRYIPTFSSLGNIGIWWGDTIHCALYNSVATLELSTDPIPSGMCFSVRCVKDK